MYLWNVLVILTFILLIEGFDINLKFCKFQCSNSCKTPENKPSAGGSEIKQPEGYYWRDFYGTIPTDAYPLGPPTQFPKTYIGLVYDPSKNGTFVTTIYSGLDYVYTVLKNETSKIDKHIQILCTKSPGELSWIKLTNKNVKAITSIYQTVRGANHMELINNRAKSFLHYIVKTNKCSFAYAGAVSSLDAKLEYTLIDGSIDTTDQFLWLMYKKADPAEQPETSGLSTSKSLFSHQFESEVGVDSNGPKFQTKITIGSCSAICTNENTGSIAKDMINMAKDAIGKAKDIINMENIGNARKMSASMAYYWKPNQVIEKTEALLAGEDYAGPLYVGQAYISSNTFDVGSSNLKKTEINQGYTDAIEAQYYHVLSSNHPDSFKWINTTAEDFSKQDKNKMIPGGAYDNGTETFVCRNPDRSVNRPGSARVLTTGTYCYSEYGPQGNFQILTFDPKNIIDLKSIIDPKGEIDLKSIIDLKGKIDLKSKIDIKGEMDPKSSIDKKGLTDPKSEIENEKKSVNGMI